MVIVGQGAMGLLWYHHINQAIKHNKQASINKLSLLSSKQDKQTLDTYQFTPYQSKASFTGDIHYTQAADIACADVFLLCVKSYQTLTTIKQLANKTSKTALFILAHNGMGTFEQVPNNMLARHAFAALLTTHGSLKQAPLTIKHTGLGVSDFGFLHNNSKIITKEACSQLIQLLNTALPEVNFQEKITEKQWLKLAINCAINPITAIHNIPNGDVGKTIYREGITAIIAEVCAVAHKEHIILSSEQLLSKVYEVAKATATNCSSMRSDILAGRETEVDYINGYIHRLGKKHNVATPQNSLMWQQVKSLS